MTRGMGSGPSEKSTPAGERGGNRGGPSKANDPTRQAGPGAAAGQRTEPEAGQGGQRFTEDTPRPDDLKRNPGIGASKGSTMAGADPDEIDGENTSEGDLENDTNADGSVNMDPGRTNH